MNISYSILSKRAADETVLTTQWIWYSMVLLIYNKNSKNFRTTFNPLRLMTLQQIILELKRTGFSKDVCHY